MKPSLLVKTLQVRQQGGLREWHRFWCWPRRSSHGRDHHGYRPCTLAPRPAPKSITALSEIDSRCPSSYCSPEIGQRSSQKNFRACAKRNRTAPGAVATTLHRSLIPLPSRSRARIWAGPRPWQWSRSWRTRRSRCSCRSRSWGGRWRGL
jgi:hypothetical protein